jgi:hypothetical protein
MLQLADRKLRCRSRSVDRYVRFAIHSTGGGEPKKVGGGCYFFDKVSVF